MITKSRLQIPKSSARPGEEPDFSYLDLSPAGAVDKPGIDVRTRDIEHRAAALFAYSMMTTRRRVRGTRISTRPNCKLACDGCF